MRMKIIRNTLLLFLILLIFSFKVQSQQKKGVSILPDHDPEPEKSIQLVDEVSGIHPRLLFIPKDISKLRELAQKEGKIFFEHMQEYLKVCRTPKDIKFLTNSTDAQRHGLWRMPTAAIHYVITGEQDSFDRTMSYMQLLLELEHWEEGQEQDSGMGAANILIGAAVAFDCLYNDLESKFREKFRNKLLTQARRMYYRGHLHKAGAPGYWKQDPQNNHRWHRNAGLSLAVLAVADKETSDEDWLLTKTLEELEFIARWLPEDGTSHEGSSYMVFGGGHLVLAFDAADRCLGTDFLKHPFFKETVSFRMQTVTPGFNDVFCFGDCAGFGGYSNYLFKCISQHRLEDHLDGVLKLMDKQPDAFWLGWWSLVWYDSTVTRGSIENLPKAKFFPDLGLGFIRDGWNEDNTAVMLKCGPYGGYLLQEYRQKHDNKYINIAHDDPDANSFLIFADSKMLADYDPYSQPKLTSSHNTILVNGKGQRHRGEGWTQPISNMMDMASITTWNFTDQAVIIEGEAGNAYDDLSRYRRSMIWIQDKYILVLDHIQAHEKAEITWLIQSAGTEILDEEKAYYRLSDGGSMCEFRMASNADFKAQIGESTANHKGKKVGYKQLQLKANTDQWYTAVVFDVWKHGDLEVKLEIVEHNKALVKVTGPDINDKWHWQSATDLHNPSGLKGECNGDVIISISSHDQIKY
ncbi:DUF4962 domain-containing protein [Candidatus Poribacteria bacterium]|nr:DUF4962 domain-containing protein [Candidatus Poribacteria bacterium]